MNPGCIRISLGNIVLKAMGAGLAPKSMLIFLAAFRILSRHDFYAGPVFPQMLDDAGAVRRGGQVFHPVADLWDLLAQKLHEHDGHKIV